MLTWRNLDSRQGEKKYDSMTYNHTHKIYLDLSFVCNQLVCITSCFVDLTYPLDFPKVADQDSLKDPPFCERKPCCTI